MKNNKRPTDAERMFAARVDLGIAQPATNGGPGPYAQFGPGDHNGYKGDVLTIRELRGGELRFDGYDRPEWPSNRM